MTNSHSLTAKSTGGLSRVSAVVRDGVTCLHSTHVDDAPDIKAASLMAEPLVDRINGAAGIFDSHYCAVEATAVTELAADGTAARHPLDFCPKPTAITS